MCSPENCRRVGAVLWIGGLGVGSWGSSVNCRRVGAVLGVRGRGSAEGLGIGCWGLGVVGRGLLESCRKFGFPKKLKWGWVTFGGVGVVGVQGIFRY